MIKLNSDKGREIISNYISALNGDSEAIKYAYDKRKAEYDTYDDELKVSVDKCFDCIQCVIEGEKVKDSDAETVPLSHLLITLPTPNSLPTRIPYNNNINDTINVTIITYTTHTVSLILSYFSASYVNNSIYFTILTTAIDIITDTNTNSNVLLLNLLML